MPYNLHTDFTCSTVQLVLAETRLSSSSRAVSVAGYAFAPGKTRSREFVSLGRSSRVRIFAAASSARERQVVNLPPIIENMGTVLPECSTSQCLRVTAAGVFAPTKGNGRTPL